MEKRGKCPRGNICTDRDKISLLRKEIGDKNTDLTSSSREVSANTMEAAVRLWEDRHETVGAREETKERLCKLTNGRSRVICRK